VDEVERLLETLESADLDELRAEHQQSLEESRRNWTGPIDRYRPSVEEPPDIELGD
jgi:hypothetical protein